MKKCLLNVLSTLFFLTLGFSYQHTSSISFISSIPTSDNTYAIALIGKEESCFISVNLSSSAGIYNNGDGKDLGNDLQFKSEINLFYSLSRESRFGLGSHHISNAGLDSVNPGTNNYYLIYNRDF